MTYCLPLDGKYLKANWKTINGTELGPEWFTWEPIRNTFRMWGFDADNFYEPMWQLDVWSEQVAKAARQKRITIIPAIHGKLTHDGKISEPDVYWIVERWLERHPEVENTEGRIRALRGRWTTADGLKTEVITVSIIAGEDIVGYDPEQDAELYEYWKAERRYWEAG